MKLQPLHIVLLVLTISSCTKVVDITIPDESNKLVVNLLMNKDSIMMARVTLSDRTGGQLGFPEITDAVVKLYENETFKETLTPCLNERRTYYRGNTLPQAGATYRVTVAVPGYAEVAGSDIIPDTVKTGEMRMAVAQTGSGVKATISVQLHDDPDVQNYYRVRLFSIDEFYDSTGNGWRSKTQQYFEVEEATLALFNTTTHPEFYTTDALFNGRSPRFIFRANTNGQFQKMAVEITTLTYSSYNYLNTAFTAGIKDEDGFSEKVIVYNNIENGLGIIGGVAQREYELVR